MQATDKEIFKANYDIQLLNLSQNYKPNARTGWAYKQFVSKLYLGNGHNNNKSRPRDKD